MQDNLNTHKPASLYEAFPAAEARRLVERFEWHYTPKHGSWLNMAEIELSVLKRQCLAGRIEKITKKERLFLTREKDKLKKVLEGIETMSRIPGAMFVVDIKKESIAIKEAQRLNIPVFAIVDTNCDPDQVDYLIPANDDAVKTVEIV